MLIYEIKFVSFFTRILFYQSDQSVSINQEKLFLTNIVVGMY